MSTEKPSEKKMQSVMDQVTDQVGKKANGKPAKRNGKTASQPKAEPKKTSKNTVNLELPVEDIDAPTFRLHIDLSLTGESAAALRKIAAGLDRDRVTLANGKRCVGTNDAVRWIAEQLSTNP